MTVCYSVITISLDHVDVPCIQDWARLCYAVITLYMYYLMYSRNGWLYGSLYHNLYYMCIPGMSDSMLLCLTCTMYSRDGWFYIIWYSTITLFCVCIPEVSGSMLLYDNPVLSVYSRDEWLYVTL